MTSWARPALRGTLDRVAHGQSGSMAQGEAEARVSAGSAVARPGWTATLLVVLLCGVSSRLQAQGRADGAALAFARAGEARPAERGLLVLRPEPGLRELAGRLAPLLELRVGARVRVGDPPPPALPEAVPAGHIALLREGPDVRLVLGAQGGLSFDSRVALAKPDGDAPVRALALAAESLVDAMLEHGRTVDATAVPASEARVAAGAPGGEPGGGDEGGEPRGRVTLGTRVETLVYARLYGGASTASSVPMAGVGTGIGLCVLGQCLFLASEIPANTGSVQSLDVRYRYVTFLSGFYSRPFSFGSLTPGASLGFLTRLGHFRADMGYRDTGLETDLGARGSLELAWELAPRFDLMSEVGMDLTLDRHRLRTQDGGAVRGDRWSPWAQAAVRFRP